MFTLPAFLGTLPPASLAEADLPRFATRALNRRTLDELPGVRALLREEPLPGYPPSLAKALLVLLDRLVEAEADPAGLDPERVERLLGTPGSLADLERLRALERTVLRPGVAVTSEIRDLLAGRLEIVPGDGPQLALVGPVEVIGMAGLGWSALRTPALARLMTPEEAEGIRDAWATVEEYSGWPRPSAVPWEARFVQVALRPNPDARRVVELLRDLAPPRRTALWRALVEHLRDEDLPDGHRPGRRGLTRRLDAAGVRVSADALDVLLPFAEAMVARCGREPLVARGLCPCTDEDIAAYTAWIEVPEGTRERLRALEPPLVEHHLRTLAAVDHGALQARLDPDLVRDLRGLRDGYLRHRYRRDVTPLLGVDPLPLAEARLATGEDRGAILEELARLAQEARRLRPVEEERARREEPEAPKPAAEAPSEPEDRAEEELSGEAPQLLPKRPPPDPPPVLEESSSPRESSPVNPFGRRSARPPSERMPTVPPPADLPPMPEPPPPRKRPLTRRPRELPPMPDVPPPRPPSTRPPTGRPRTRPAPPPADPPAPVGPEGRAPDRAEPPQPRPPSARPRTSTSREQTVPHLTTPGQATEFYEVAFRELEVLERDLLERGPWAEARRRVAELEARAAELIAALGPPARSGDAAFRGALRKVELVSAYLDRIRLLLEEQPRGPAEAQPEPEEPAGVLGRLGRLFRRDRDDE
ncbi:MAG: hypothetical protein ACQEXJ_06930 [Myxococcota bacterium]